MAPLLGPLSVHLWPPGATAPLLRVQWLAVTVLPASDTAVVNLGETAMPRQLVGSRGSVMAMAQGSSAMALV